MKIVQKLLTIVHTLRFNQMHLTGKLSLNMKGDSSSRIVDIGADKKSATYQAANLLESGEVIALPTDTVYGLACSANDPRAIQRLYSIKGRENRKPVAICVPDIKKLRHWGQANHLTDELLKKLLPGPVTIVVKKSEYLNNPHLNPGVEKIGIRIPDSGFIRDVSKAFKHPVALTSANKSSEPSTLNIREFKKLWPVLSAVFDGGQLGRLKEQRAASTVIDLSEAGRYKIIRDGVAIKRTIEVVQNFGFKKA